MPHLSSPKRFTPPSYVVEIGEESLQFTLYLKLKYEIETRR